jgi:galactokinase
MDQAAALRCRVGHALLLDCRDGSKAQVPFVLSAHGLSLRSWTLAPSTPWSTGSMRSGATAARKRPGSWACPRCGRWLSTTSTKTLDRLPDTTIRARARHVVTEIERVRQTVALLRAGRLPEVGPLFDASHASMRDDFEISCRA